MIPSHSPTIHRGALLRTLIAPLIVWGTLVVTITASGQPGIVCVTPMAWLLALWSGGQYIRLSKGQPGRRPLLGAALIGAGLGLGMGVLFILVSAWAMPVGTDPNEVRKMQLFTVCISGGGIVVCAALSVFTAWLTLRRYGREQ
jgi:hypothetical protein